MPFSIGDRVVPLPGEYYPVGRDNIGTVTDINYEDQFCIINWDNDGPDTYHMDENENQWNISFQYLKHYEEPIDETTYKNSPYFNIIRKIKRMEKKRKDQGYAF